MGKIHLVPPGGKFFFSGRGESCAHRENPARNQAFRKSDEGFFGMGKMLGHLVEQYAGVALFSPGSGGGKDRIVAVADVTPVGQKAGNKGRALWSRTEIQNVAGDRNKG